VVIILDLFTGAGRFDVIAAGPPCQPFSERAQTVKRVRLGAWTLPSGNRCRAFILPGAGVRELAVEWSTSPPLRVDDRAFYEVVVRPAIIRRYQEYTEQPGEVLVITA
jgi:hypothetical protein